MRLPKKALLMMAIALLAGIILLFAWPGPKNIHEAVYARDVAAVKRFIETGVDLDAVNKDGYTPLHIAASGDFPEIIEILIDAGAEIEKVDKCGITALGYAVQAGKLEAVAKLVSMGADVNARSPRFRVTPIYAATWGLGDYLGVAQFLVEHGADVNVHDTAGCTPLHRAVENAEPELVRFFFKGWC